MVARSFGTQNHSCEAMTFADFNLQRDTIQIAGWS
jgi:hypothetical protein